MSVTVVEGGDPADEGSAEVNIPSVPWHLQDDGTLATVPQGGTAELAQSVRLALSTRARNGIGERRCAQDYGTSDWRFVTRLAPQAIVEELATVEPRATVDVDVQAYGARNDITVTVAAEEV